MPLIRPKLLIETARIGARSYQRERDLPGAVAGLAGRAAKQILARLSEAERNCEDLRRARSPAYRPGKHVQILSALIAESGRDGEQTPVQPNASGSAALRLAM
jgi:hypothetical protein